MNSDFILKLVIGFSIVYFTSFHILTPYQKEITTASGLECVVYKSSIVCNHEKYNHDTKFGEFPYSER